jgi:hypothetical protein
MLGPRYNFVNFRVCPSTLGKSVNFRANSEIWPDLGLLGELVEAEVKRLERRVLKERLPPSKEGTDFMGKEFHFKTFWQ